MFSTQPSGMIIPGSRSLKVMRAIKGGWVRQTFALAKCNESEPGGKKTRIRRSKEERKAMVESFIKKYQKKNNGDFPSLNLTHKEVGGSFYIVREIVREIIQENRVLGPAKPIPEEEDSNQFLEENPLGSIATEPQISIMLPHETWSVSNNEENINKNSELVLNGNFIEHKESEVLDGQTINGAQVAMDNKKSVESEIILVKDHKSPEANVQNESESPKVTSLDSVEVEMFPLRSHPSTKQTDRTDESLVEVVDLVGAPEAESITETYVESGCNGSLLQKTDTQENSSFTDETPVLCSDDQLVEQRLASEDTKGEEVVSNSSEEKSGAFATKEAIEVTTNGTNSGKDVDNKAPGAVALSASMLKSEKEVAVMEATNSVNSCDTKCLKNHTITAEVEKSNKGAEIKTVAEPQQNGSLQKDGTMDRINLESWEVASKKSSKQEKNPLLASLKAFVVSLVKFWTE